MMAEVRPLLNMGGATSWRSQGRTSVIADSSLGFEVSRVPPSLVPELGVSVASSIVFDKDGDWIPTSLGSVPLASSLLVTTMSEPMVSSASPFLDPSVDWIPTALVTTAKRDLESLNFVRAPQLSGLAVDTCFSPM